MSVPFKLFNRVGLFSFSCHPHTRLVHLTLLFLSLAFYFFFAGYARPFSSRTRTSPRLPSAGSVKTVGGKDSTHLCFPPLSLLQGRVCHPNGCSNGLGGLPSCKQRHTLRERNCEDTRRSRRHGYGRHLDGPKGATPFPALAAIFLPRPAYIYPIPTLLLYHVCFTGTMTNVCPLLGSIF